MEYAVGNGLHRPDGGNPKNPFLEKRAGLEGTTRKTGLSQDCRSA